MDRNPRRRMLVLAAAMCGGAALTAGPMPATARADDNNQGARAQFQLPGRGGAVRANVPGPANVGGTPARVAPPRIINAPSRGASTARFGLGGVRSEGPRPIRLGGVRAQAPSRIGASGTLLNRDRTLLPTRSVTPASGRTPPRQVIDRGRAVDAFVLRGRSDGVRVRIGASGVSAKGRFDDGDVRLRFRVGSPAHPLIGHRFGNRVYSVYPYLYPYVYPTGLYSGYGYWYDNVCPVQWYPDQSLSGLYQAPAPQAAAPAEQPRELTDLEKADIALWRGDADEAVQLYKSYLNDHEPEPQVLRALALALLDARHPEEGVAVMAMAYENEPALSSRAVDPDALEGGRREMRDRVRRAVIYANKVDSSSSWLTVAVLMQAEGRDRVAAKMIERAHDAGLSEDVYKQMKSALGG